MAGGDSGSGPSSARGAHRRSRERILWVIGLIAAGFGPLSIGLWLWMRPPPKIDFAAIVAIAANSCGAFVLLARRMPFRLRAITALLVLYGAGALFTAKLGFQGSPVLTLTLGVVLGAALFGRRATFALLALSTLTLLVTGVLIATGHLAPPRPAPPDVLITWVSHAVNFAFLAGLAGATVAHVLREAEAGHDAAEKALGDLDRVTQERRRADLAAHESQRLETIGRLAGGVAHDFNNALVVIMSWADLVKRRPADPGKAQQGLDAISKAAEGAAKLTKQLLLLTRRPRTGTRTFAPGPLMAALAVSLRRLLPEDFPIETKVDALPDVLYDESELNQRLLAAVLNARDAMPGGGTIVIAAAATGAAAGVTVSVTHGETTTPILTMPEASSPARAAERAPAAATPPHALRILLVEDEAAVRAVMAQALRDAGHEVLEAADGERALTVSEDATARLDAMITDGVMPGVGARTLIDRFRTLRPRASILLCSGHLDEELVRRGITESGVAFLSKPFTAEALVAKVRELRPGA